MFSLLNIIIEQNTKAPIIIFKYYFKIMQTVEIINTHSSSVSCNGKVAPYDHPKVYLEIDKAKGNILCPYCYKKFVLTQ
jgi:uncharacterized Zn-finger protein